VPTAIAITDPKVVNVESLGEASKIQVQGTAIGTTDLIVQFGAGIPPMIYELTVHRDMSDLIRRIDAVVEGEPPRVYPLGERIVVEGEVDDLDTLEKVALVSRIYDEMFVNLMTVRGDHQVQLEVVFAEVSRTGTRDLGLNILWSGNGLAAGMFAPTSAGATVLNEAADAINTGRVRGTAAGAYSIGAFAPVAGQQLSGVLSILDGYNLGKVLAQQTLLSLSGQQAEFHSGGEVPIPAPSGGGGSTAIRVEYKPYGVHLVFVPTVLANDVVDVRVTVEVSELDPATGTRITGFELPGLVTRKGDTHLRVESGMTFAIAGMLSEKTTMARVGVPGLGRIPLIGSFFRTIHHVREEKEVVIFVTPRMVRPLAPGEVPAAPGSTENNNPSDLELFILGVDHRPGSRTAQPTGAVGLQR
jgi:pilus assembly protein CpaC